MSAPSGRPSMLISRSLPADAVTRARAGADVDVNEADAPLPRNELIRRLQGRQGLVCMISEAIDEELLASCPDLMVASNVAVGFNNIDVAAATRLGVVVTNTPDVLTETTADFAWTLLMAISRRVVEADRYVREGKFDQWKNMLLLGGDIHGKTLGIVGFGRIGRAVLSWAVTHRTERELRASRTDIATLLKESDFVTLHTPLLPETRHLINAQSLKTMKKTAYLINASRGPVVDEAALAQALKEGWIAGAGIDVFEDEPKIHPGLMGLTNAVLAPHIGSASWETRLQMANLAVDNCLAVLEGRTPPTPVNAEALTRR